MDAELDALAFRFFKLFAQYEFTLKAMHYGRAGAKQAAEADWDGFANDFGVVLLKSADAAVVEARQYLLDHPPNRQVWTEVGVAWEPVPNHDKSAQMLFSHIRRMRNNLYHGGKFRGWWLEPDRSKELISKSLLLLEALIALHPQLQEAIQGNAG
jgi:hypothetical protein